MKAFIINLKSEEKRRKQITKQCDTYNIDYEMINAINGHDLADEAISAITYDYPDCLLTKGEIGCALSHMSIYSKILSEDIHCALILEDDAILDQRINSYINFKEDLISKTKPEVFLLTANCEYNEKIKFVSSENYEFYRLSQGCCSHGYIINQMAARKILKHNLPIRLEADRWVLFRYMFGLRVWCSKNDIIKNSDIAKSSSTLENERKKHVTARLARLDKLKKSARFYQFKRFKNLMLNKSGIRKNDIEI